ncbi:MAG: LytR/AlgR family response regulator transcription factor [Bacteroidia bacterium]
MSNKVRILLVEDELIIAESLSEILQSLGYHVVGIEVKAEEALRRIDIEQPDFAILDIQLKGDKDGIWLADEISKKYGFPFIFLTSYGDEKTVKQALSKHPYGYLLKPFEKMDIFTAIECALSVADRSTIAKATKTQFKDFLFIKDDHAFVKVKFSELLYVKANGNYVEVFTDQKRLLIRTTMKEILPKLPAEDFMQIHRSYTVNLNCIDKFSASTVVIGKSEIPISSQNRDELMKRFMTH